MHSDSGYLFIKKAPIRPAIPPIYIIPGIPRFRLPDFLCHDLSKRTIQNTDALDNCFLNKNGQYTHCIFLLFLCTLYSVIDKKFCSDQEKQNDSKDYIRCILVQSILCRNLNSTLIHEYDTKRNSYHNKGIEFGKPRNDDRCKSAATCCRSRDRMARAADNYKSCDTADRTG